MCYFFAVPTVNQQTSYSQQPGFPQQQNYTENVPTLSAPPKYDNLDFKTPLN